MYVTVVMLFRWDARPYHGIKRTDLHSDPPAMTALLEYHGYRKGMEARHCAC